jgi:hypothetical protein
MFFGSIGNVGGFLNSFICNIYEVWSALGGFFTTILYPLRGTLRRRYSFVDKFYLGYWFNRFLPDLRGNRNKLFAMDA